MSYSRWSYSKWYSFWNVSGDGMSKEKQCLSLWTKGKIIDWTYDELLELTNSEIEKIYECSFEDAEEAMLYIKEFIDEVNRNYG